MLRKVEVDAPAQTQIFGNDLLAQLDPADPLLKLACSSLVLTTKTTNTIGEQANNRSPFAETIEG